MHCLCWHFGYGGKANLSKVVSNCSVIAKYGKVTKFTISVSKRDLNAIMTLPPNAMV
jgi:hypothetical protein